MVHHLTSKWNQLEMHRNAIFLVNEYLIKRIFPNRICLLGNGTNPNLQVGEEYTISVDTHEAGPGAVTCRIRSTLGNDLDIDIVDNEDGTFNLFYTPHNPGNYVIKIKFGGQDIPGGDFVVTVSLRKCKTQLSSSCFLLIDLPLQLI